MTWWQSFALAFVGGVIGSLIVMWFQARKERRKG